MRIPTTLSLLVVSAAAGFANADIVQIDAQSAIFDAGQDVPTLDGLLPPGLSIPSGAVSMTLPTVTGEVRANPILPFAGPDGNTQLDDTNITSFNGISGILAPTTLPLLGVFLVNPHTGNENAPSRLDFHSFGYDFSSLTPLLGQTFFIGDGQTSTGLLQTFNVPDGATTLYLGLADAGFFTGAPGAYADNDGSFTADVQFQAVPAPGAIALLGLGGMMTIRRKRA